MQLAEIAEHVLRADLDGAGTPGMQPACAARYDLHLDRLFLRFDWLEGIERVRADPDHAAEKQNDK